MDCKKLSLIISIAHKTPVDTDMNSLMIKLTEQNLLPKKMFPKDINSLSTFATSKAKEFCKDHAIDTYGHSGSGKNGSFTISDLKKIQLKSMIKPKLVSSPQAKLLAESNHIDLSTVTGSGLDGRIKVEDVQNFIDNYNSITKYNYNITPQALVYAKEKNLSDQILQSIFNSSDNNKIYKSDIINFISNSNNNSDNDSRNDSDNDYQNDSDKSEKCENSDKSDKPDNSDHSDNEY